LADRDYRAGDRAAQSRDLKAAERLYEEAARAEDPTAAVKLGLLREHRGDTEGAYKAYQQADEAGSGFGALRLGLLLAADDQWDEAEAAYARADERGTELEGLDLGRALRRTRRPRLIRAAAPDAPRPSALANPILVGAMTVLIVIVGVFLAYNANDGLPFVPTRQLKVDVASGSDLVPGNDVDEGGSRIGLVQAMNPITLPSGQVAAQLTLALSESNGKVPVDSHIAVRPRSVLGLKYVDLVKGSSRQVYADGGTMPISHTEVPVQFEDIFSAFTPKTRTAVQKDLVGFGDTLTGRGSALNDTIASLPALFRHLQPVAAYLSSPNTELVRFFNSLEGFMGTVAPVAGTNARLFTDMATTFEAFSRSPSSLEQTIAESPSTEAVSTQSLKVQQPFLVDLSKLGTQLAPATLELKKALPNINPAIEEGTKTLARTPALNSKLQGVMYALDHLARAPGTNIGINALTSTVSILNPMIKYLGPYQTVCDDWNYFWTYLSDVFSQQTSYGFAQRALLNTAQSTQTNNVSQAGATAPVDGGGSTSLAGGGNEFLHGQAYGAAVDTAGNADCETGQRGYPLKLNYYDPQQRNLGTDAHTPGDQGPTFAGSAHVPKGETFTRSPTTGPQLASVPGNN
jgi:ABC-type transporter Mla subunit MlaD